MFSMMADVHHQNSSH